MSTYTHTHKHMLASDTIHRQHAIDSNVITVYTNEYYYRAQRVCVDVVKPFAFNMVNIEYGNFAVEPPANTWYCIYMLYVVVFIQWPIWGDRRDYT